MTTTMLIDLHCRRCDHRRLVRFGWSTHLFCFNCRALSPGDGHPVLKESAHRPIVG